MTDLLKDINEAQRLDQLLPGDHPERHNFDNFNEDMINKGAIVNKCKPRWENPFYRYIHAKQDIRNGEDVLAIPLDQWITLE